MTSSLRRRARQPGGPFASPVDFTMALIESEAVRLVEAAVARRDVILAFQPVAPSARPDEIAFYEGLIRVLDESGRIIPARDFIDHVEPTTLGRMLDAAALDLGFEALAQAPDLRLALNMSARSIRDRAWRAALEHGLAQDASAGERLILEITEQSAMEFPEDVVGFMAEMQGRGICFALDDFGAGQTSFRYLRAFYFDILKIDRQFIDGVADNPDNQVLTGALKAVADHFDMLTVAEGVERAEDAAYVAALGIDCMQGYYFGAPRIAPPWMETRSSGLRA